MALPRPVPGLIVGYATLWHDQSRVGLSEGREDRPCAVVAAIVDEDGDTIVYVVPITHAPPTEGSRAVELPPAAKRRLGLDDAPSWIVTSELNRFVWPGYDLRPVSRDRPDTFAFGFLPVEVFSAVKRAIGLHGRDQRLKVVARET